MISKTVGIQCTRKLNSTRFYKNYATSVNVKIDQLPSGNAISFINDLQQEWLQAKSYKSVPGPTKFQMIRGFLKGGEFHGKTFDEVTKMCRQRYGDIYVLPGMFGQNTNLFSYNLKDYQKIFRTEGPYPDRSGVEAIMHYRLSRKNLYDEDNLGVMGNGAQWGKFRHAVNPVLMQPKNTVLYIDPMQKVNNEFIQRIREIRDPSSQEVPADFLSEIHHLSFESVAIIALDKEMGLIRNASKNSEAAVLFKNLQVFNIAMYELGIKPSIYKYVKTPTYKRFEKSMDIISDTCHKMVLETMERIERNGGNGEGKSVLEKLLKIDRKIAIIMAIDMLIGGVEATSSTLSGILLCIATNPEKQQKLREEILTNIGKTEKFTMENMKNLPYLRACIKEAMRMYPIIPGIIRSTGMDLCLSGYQIPKGTHVFLASNKLLQEERYFPKPRTYLPERWLRTAESQMSEFSVKNISPFIFLPFGFGPRSCVGKRIVDLELEITLANIVRNFKLEYNYSTENAFRCYFMNTCVLPLKFKCTDVN